MKTVEAVIVGYRPAWAKWPDTQDTNYDSVLSQRVNVPYTVNGEPVGTRVRYYPVHRAYVMGGSLALPVAHPFINNTVLPPQGVLDAMIRDLESLAADGVKLCLWEHAYQCYPYVAQHLKRIFKHSVLIHGDDCPGSTEIKTQPIAKFFDSVFHCNITWHPNGERTADLYKRLGCTDTHYVALSPTGGFLEGLAAAGWITPQPPDSPATAVLHGLTGKPFPSAAGFNMDRRVAQLRAGQYSHDVVFVGGMMGPHRPIYNMVASADAFRAARMRAKFHGVGMRDDVLPPRSPANIGYPVAALYLDSFAVLNIPFIGLISTRSFDAWASGSLLIQHDPVNELGALDVKPGVHYVEFDGTIPDLIAKVRYYQGHMDETEAILRAGHEIGAAIPRQYSMLTATTRVLEANVAKWGW